MAKMKKAVLFLVEGITDQVALEGILSQLLESNDVRFQLTNTDITTKEGVNTHNILDAMWGCIKAYLQRMRYKKSDIFKIVHLVDTDGAFIPQSAVKHVEAEKIQYFHSHIETKNTDYILNRNERKASCLNKLVGKEGLAGIPYEIYFFSSNREHVFHDIQRTLSKEEKMELAERFSDTYSDHPDEFMRFINLTNIAVRGDYRSSWTFIRQNSNSLKRFSNFHLFFDE